MANVDIQLGYKDSAWFTSNATLVLLAGQSVHLLQTGTYKIGDGTTILSSLSFLGAKKTSDLINDGDDGNPFISLNDLPSNIILYPTTAASDISGYFKLVSSISDASYDVVAVNVSTGAITTTSQLISSLATSANILVGNPGVFNITTIGNITRVSGTGTAEFYFEVYKRTLAGTETLIVTSGNTIPVLNSGYSEFSATGLWNDGSFLATDRIVLKFYGNRIVGGSNPTYNFQFGGSTPVRTLVPVPLTVTPTADPNVQSVTSAATVTPTTLNDEVVVTAQAVALNIANPTGTALQGQSLIIRIKDNGTARAITYDTQYRAIGVTLPSTTIISKTVYLGFIYNSNDTKWDCIGVAQQA